jgi:hydrogenase expression/formation protein HypC
MCVALPGKVLEINEKTAVIDFSGNQVTARTGLVEVQVGDYVLVHAGCVIQKVTPQDAEDLTELMKDVKTIEF